IQDTDHAPCPSRGGGRPAGVRVLPRYGVAAHRVHDPRTADRRGSDLRSARVSRSDAVRAIRSALADRAMSFPPGVVSIAGGNVMKLYYHPRSRYSQKVLIALYEKQVPFTPVVLFPGNPDDRAELRKLTPIGKV